MFNGWYSCILLALMLERYRIEVQILEDHYLRQHGNWNLLGCTIQVNIPYMVLQATHASVISLCHLQFLDNKVGTSLGLTKYATLICDIYPLGLFFKVRHPNWLLYAC